MNIMNRITLNMLRQNKRRTIVTIIGIILSTAMIAAVSTFSASFSDLFYRQEIDSSGDWHVSLRNASNEEIKRAQSDFSIDRAGRSTEEDTSFEAYTGSKIPEPIIFCEENVLSLNGIKASEGRLPNKPGEIILQEDFRVQGDRPITIGQTITLPIGEAVENPDDPTQQILSPTRTETFTVVGFFNRSLTTFAIKETAYFEALPAKNFTFHIDPLPASLYETLSNYPEEIGVQTHTTLLYHSGIFGDSGIMETLMIPVAIVGFIIFAASIMLIYNAFSISVSERSRQFGMLASIGATRKQKRNAVFFEGLVLGAIAIPIGIISGIVGIGITFWAISPWMMEAFGMTVPLQVKVVPLALLGAVLFSTVTILVSAWIPARRAARTTPIDAIRQTADIKLRAKKVKTPKFIEKLFGFEGTLALKNLKRYAKRYRATVFSLTVSIVLFLTTATFTSYMGQLIAMTRPNIQADVVYERSHYQGADEPLPPNVLREMRTLGTVTRMQNGSEIFLYAENGDALSDDMKSLRKQKNADEDSFYLRLLTLDQQSLAEYCKEANLPADILEAPNAAIVVNPIQIYFHEEKKRIRMNAFSEEIGQTLPLAWTEGYGEESPSTGEYEKHILTIPGIDLTLAAYTDVRPLHVDANSELPTLIVSKETYDTLLKSIDDSTHTLLFDPKNEPYGLESFNIYERTCEFTSFQSTDSTALTKILDENYAGKYRGFVNDLAEQLRSSRRMIDLMSVFFYGFITLIALVTVANVFNTVSTGIALRTREFAMLRSVGMTKKGFNRMIRLESVFYGLKSLLYGLPVSIALCALIYSVLRNDFTFPFFLPIVPILIAVCTIFFIVSLTMLYASSKVKKANIVSALTSEVF